MLEIKYNIKNQDYIFILGTEKELILLDKYFNLIPDYMYLPTYTGIKRAEIFLHKINNKLNIRWAWRGLWKNIQDTCIELNIEFKSYIDSSFKYLKETASLTQETLYNEILKWNLKISPREYQIQTAYLILKYKQSLYQIATRSGKTLIAYIVFRYLLEHKIINNCLLVVPSVQLIKQGIQDFKEYGIFFQTEEIWARGEYCESSTLTIGTFQSLIKHLNDGWLEKFDSICIDEAHHLTCNSIKNILLASTEKKHSWGFTGTLPKEKTIESFCCHALMGPTVKKISTADLIDGGWIVPPDITQIYIKHSAEEVIPLYIKYGEELIKDTIIYKKRSNITPGEYAKYIATINIGASGFRLEQQVAIYSQTHQECIVSIISKIENKNIIIFAHSIEYIKYLKIYLENIFKNYQIYIIQGQTTPNNRLKIVNILNNNTNCILIASYGTMSTGITLKNIDIGIFAQTFKSRIISLQSIGRGLLKQSEKNQFKVYDLVDILPFTQRLKKHAYERRHAYEEEKFKVIIENFSPEEQKTF